MLTKAKATMKRLRPVLISAYETLQNDVPKKLSDMNLQPMSKIPGPSSLPFIGSVSHLVSRIGNRGKEFVACKNVEDMYKTFGKVVKRDSMFGLNPIIFILDPELGEQVLRAENLNTSRKAYDTLVYYRTEVEQKKFEGARGLLVEQEAPWREFRQKVNVPLLDLKMIRKYSAQIEEVTMEFIERLKHLRNNKNMVAEDLSDEINKWSLESICLVALGTRLGTLKEGNENPLIKRLMEANNEIFHLVFELDARPSLWKFYSTHKYKKIMKAYADQTRISEHYIQQALERFKTKNNDGDTDLSILEKLLAIDHKTAVVMAGDMMLAGIDTVKVVICNEFFSNSESQFPRPNEFLPERWICEKTDPLHYSKAHPFSVLPFGFGSRVCIGRRLAEMELEILVSHLIKHFEVEWVGPRPKKFRSTLTYYMPPYNFVFKDV